MPRITEFRKQLAEDIKNGLTFKTWEARLAEGSPIRFPDFHFISFHDSESNVMIGHCLDYNVTVFADELDEVEAENTLFYRMTEAVQTYFISCLKNNCLDQLFDDSGWLFDDKSIGYYYTKQSVRAKIYMFMESVLPLIKPDTEPISEEEISDAVSKELEKKGQMFMAMLFSFIRKTRFNVSKG